MKQPGQVAYEAYTTKPVWDRETDAYKAVWAHAEAAVLAAYAKPERPAGVWLEFRGGVEYQVWIALTLDLQVYNEGNGWIVGRNDPSNGDWIVTENCARRIVEALGGEWPEDKQA